MSRPSFLCSMFSFVHLTNVSAAALTLIKSLAMLLRLSCVAITIRWAERMSILSVWRYLESGVVWSNILRNICAVNTVSYLRRPSLKLCALARIVGFSFSFFSMAASVSTVSMKRPSSCWPKCPNTFLTASCLAHHRASPIGERRLWLCLVFVFPIDLPSYKTP